MSNINREAALAHLATLDIDTKRAIQEQMEVISMMAECFSTRPYTIVSIFQAAGQAALDEATDASKISKVLIEGLRQERGDEWADGEIALLTQREADAGGYAPEVDFSQFPALVAYLEAADSPLAA